MKTIVYETWMRDGAAATRRSARILEQFDLEALKQRRRAPGRARRLAAEAAAPRRRPTR